MPYSIRQLTFVAAVMALVFLACAQAKIPELKQDKVLAREVMPDGSKLVLYERQVGLPSMTAQLRYALSTKPSAGAKTDTAFYLVHVPWHSTQASIVWATYRSLNSAMPMPKIAAKLINGPDGLPLLIFVDSLAPETTISIYKADLRKPLAEMPLHLDNERREEWPHASESLGSITYRLSKNEAIDICAVSAIDASWKRDAIMVRAERSPSVCGPLVTTFDVSTGKWSEVRRIGTVGVPMLR